MIRLQPRAVQHTVLRRRNPFRQGPFGAATPMLRPCRRGVLRLARTVQPPLDPAQIDDLAHAPTIARRRVRCEIEAC